jgi:hypothetical protein
MLKRRIATVGVLILLLIGTVGALSSCVTKSIDDVWIAKLETDKSSDTGKSVTISGVMPKYLNQRELVIPERIDGHPVKKLFKFRQLFTDAESGSAELGELRRLTIEASVEIVGQFFNGSKVFLIEFTNLTPSTFRWENSWLPLVIIPDGSSEDYLKNSNPYLKSEVINDYLIKDGVFGGYIGNDTEIEIPEGVIGIMKGEYRFKLLITTRVLSVKFPTTIQVIQKNSLFYDFSRGNLIDELNGLKTVYVPYNTIIEEDAFSSKIEIIRY